MSEYGLRVSFLRTEYLVNPLGIDERHPRLSWLLDAGSGRRGVTQRAYQIVVASDQDLLAHETGDLWDTGWVESADTAQIVYDGAALASRQTAWWIVRVWDGDDARSDWSEVASWERGLDKLTDWKANWITMPRLVVDEAIAETQDLQLDALLPVPHFRRSFSVTGKLARARLYATARGVYEARLNGTKVGDHQLAPGWTDYTRRIQVQTYDVTEAIREGENVLGALVGTGWYAGYVGFEPGARHYGTTPQWLAQLHLDYADGTSEVIATDKNWRSTTGPIRYSDMLMGEYYDAPRELPGWDAPGFDGTAWSGVGVQSKNATPLICEPAEPVRAQDRIVPIGVTEPEPGVYIFDLGQNIAGWARLAAEGPAGTIITLRFAEILNPDGTLYRTNLRRARATDTWVLRGEGTEIFEPRFTWHGFRYIEISGYPGVPSVDAVIGIFVGSDTRPVGDFTCSDELVNQLQRNIVWGQRGNFLSIPTDCPQRDERLGWLGDAQVFAGTAMGNMDVAAFFTKWMQDVVDGQSEAGAFPDVAPRLVNLSDGAPAWGDCGVILPWTMWRTYGDTRIVEKHWDAMERWMDWLLNANPNLLWTNNRSNDFGDWLSIGADTPKELIGTAYFAYDAHLMAEMAAVIGREHDAGRYRRLHEDVAAAFCAAYVQEDGTIEGETQSAYCLALHFGLLPPALREKAAARLVANIEAKGGHLSTGFVGVSYLCHVLTNNGYPEVAYRLLHNETFPSWKYSILHGATTIWERWDGWTEEGGFQDPSMNSFNHYSLGSVGEWLRRTVAGVETAQDAPGYGHLRIRPVLDDSLTFAEGRYDSIRGTIRSRWERSSEGISLAVTIPVNVSAEVWIPVATGGALLEGGAPVSDVNGVTAVLRDGDHTVVHVGSGSYVFSVPTV
jgi:alpha-L-rhamnosidase